jgi:glycosyltransferase involved in cell wall biosynthesis
MLHIHHVNLQPIVGGGEVYTRSFTRALAEAGARVTLYVHESNRFWDGVTGGQVERVPVADETQLLARLPQARSVVVTQGPTSPRVVSELASRHLLTGFAHMPMYQRSPDNFRPYRLVFTVSKYCIDLLRRAGLTQVHAEPIYGTADVRRDDAPVVLRSPYITDRRKFRDVLIGAAEALLGTSGAGTPFTRSPGLTLGVVSLISPIKQFPALFSIVAPLLARRPQVRLEVFGNGGYAQVRDLRRALAPLEGRVRFWGYQSNVAAIYPQLDYLMTGLPEKEALGLNALEAQSCGTPVLAPAAPPFTETVADGASGFLYRDPREDGGAHFEEIVDAILAGRPRPDPRVAAKDHLAQFADASLVGRARRVIEALSTLE